MDNVQKTLFQLALWLQKNKDFKKNTDEEKFT
jgi:hypothetical protein